MRDFLAQTLAESPTREWMVYLLGNVPGLPPIAQSFHIMGIAAVVGSIVMIDLKFLGVALPNQNVSEMIRRLLPWTWYALAVNAATGLIFVLARPDPLLLQPGRHLQVLVPPAGRGPGVRRLPDEPEAARLLGAVRRTADRGPDHRRRVAAALDRRPARRALDRVLGVHHRSFPRAVRLGGPGGLPVDLAVDAGPPDLAAHRLHVVVPAAGIDPRDRHRPRGRVDHDGGPAAARPRRAPVPGEPDRRASCFPGPGRRSWWRRSPASACSRRARRPTSRTRRSRSSSCCCRWPS